MMKRIIAGLVLLLSFAGAQELRAQSDVYKNKGDAYVNSGEFSLACDQYQGGLAFLDAKRVNKQSDSYIELEKRLSYAKTCADLSKSAKANLNALTSEAIRAAFQNCESVEEAEEVQKKLLSNLDAARRSLRGILEKFPRATQTGKDLAACQDKEAEIRKAGSNMDEIFAWRAADSAKTLEAYQAFLTQFAQGTYSEEARTRIRSIQDFSAWENARTMNTLDGYRSYLEEFPKGEHAGDAEELIRTQEEDLLWNEIRGGASTDVYERYIKGFPSGPHIDQVKSLLLLKQDDDYWAEQLSKDTKASYNAYLAKYRNGRHAAQARNNIDRIDERSAWQQALAADSIEGYEAYLASSKKKAYEEDARERIAEIRHEQEVAADEQAWAKVTAAGGRSDFEAYLAGTGFKGHEDEARSGISVLDARSFYTGNDPESAVAAYRAALRHIVLEPEDTQRYEESLEMVAYNQFASHPDVSTASQYLAAYSQGRHSGEVSDFIAKTKADGMTLYATEKEFSDAMSYARSPRAQSYVRSAYADRQRDYKKLLRRQKHEPIHVLFGLEGVYYPAFESTGESTVELNMDAVEAYDIAPLLSIGGHSNRLNLELGYYILQGQAFVRPKVNLLKKRYQGTDYLGRRSGSDYTIGYFYLAPEIYYDVVGNYSSDDVVETAYDPELDEWYPVSSSSGSSAVSFGAKAGLGFGNFELHAGYRVDPALLSVGVSFYFGKK